MTTIIAQSECQHGGGTLTVTLWEHERGRYEVEAMLADADNNPLRQEQANFPLLSAARDFYCETVIASLHMWQHKATPANA